MANEKIISPNESDDSFEHKLPFKDLSKFQEAIDKNTNLDADGQVPRMGNEVELKEDYFHRLTNLFDSNIKKMRPASDAAPMYDQALNSMGFEHHDGMIRFNSESYKIFKNAGYDPDSIIEMLRGVLAETCYYALDEESNIRPWLGKFKEQISNVDKLSGSHFVFGLWQPLISRLKEHIFKTLTDNSRESSVENLYIERADILEPRVIVESMLSKFLLSMNGNRQNVEDFNLRFVALIRLENTLYSSLKDGEDDHSEEKSLIDDIKSKFKRLKDKEDIIELSKAFNEVSDEWMENPGKGKIDALNRLLGMVHDFRQDKGFTKAAKIGVASAVFAASLIAITFIAKNIIPTPIDIGFIALSATAAYITCGVIAAVALTAVVYKAWPYNKVVAVVRSAHEQGPVADEEKKLSDTNPHSSSASTIPSRLSLLSDDGRDKLEETDERVDGGKLTHAI